MKACQGSASDPKLQNNRFAITFFPYKTQTFSFLEYVLACKKLDSSIHSEVAHNYPKNIKVILNFPEFASACKKLAHFIHSPCAGWPQSFLTKPTPIFFYQLLISNVNMQNIRLFHHFVLETYIDLKSCYLIGQKLFDQCD